MFPSTASHSGGADVVSSDENSITEEEALLLTSKHGHGLKVPRYTQWFKKTIQAWDVQKLLKSKNKPYTREQFMTKISKELSPIAIEKQIALWHLYCIRDTRALRTVLGLQ